MQEWTVVDSDTGNFELVTATSQKEAWRIGASRGAVAKKTDHVRPRTGDANLMKKGEFEDFLEKYL